MCPAPENAPKDADRHPFAHVLVGAFPRLTAYARSIVGDQMTAEDVVAEVFSRVLKKGHAPPPSYLRAAVRNEALNVIRSLNRRMRRVRMWKESLPERPSTLGPAKALERALEWDRVERLLSTLPTRQREAARLRFLGALSYPAIADRMGVNIASARRLVYRARKSLQRVLPPKTP